MFSLYSYIEIQACLSFLTLKYVTIQKLDNLEMPFHPAFKIELDNQEIMNKHVICKNLVFDLILIMEILNQSFQLAVIFLWIV